MAMIKYQLTYCHNTISDLYKIILWHYKKNVTGMSDSSRLVVLAIQVSKNEKYFLTIYC